jgi:hypothetical protein
MIGTIWKEISELSIREAAFLMLGIDPEIHDDRCDRDSDYWDYFSSHPISDQVNEKIHVLSSAVNVGKIAETRRTPRADGAESASDIFILKSDYLKWMSAHGYDDIVKAFSYGAESAPPESSPGLTGDGRRQTPPRERGQLSSEHQDEKLRGCKRHIAEHWPAIRKLRGPDADAHHVLNELKKHLEARELPKLKTVQNCLIALRNKNLIP